VVNFASDKNMTLLNLKALVPMLSIVASTGHTHPFWPLTGHISYVIQACTRFNLSGTKYGLLADVFQFDENDW
jgi:hypothetical protein